MAYIYCITNDINGKQYIGKTVLPVEERFKQHCSDRLRRPFEKRPLYNAMNKYGIEHFHIEILEEVDYSQLSEREVYWIKEKNTYYNGYNATFGGEGRCLTNYDLVCEVYQQTLNQKKTAELLHIDVNTVKTACEVNNIPILKQGITPKTIQIDQYDKNGNFIQSFHSCGEAARYLISQNITSAKVGTVTNRIIECTQKNHVRKSAYGYIWKKK